MNKDKQDENRTLYFLNEVRETKRGMKQLSQQYSPQVPALCIPYSCIILIFPLQSAYFLSLF